VRETPEREPSVADGPDLATDTPGEVPPDYPFRLVRPRRNRPGIIGVDGHPKPSEGGRTPELQQNHI